MKRKACDEVGIYSELHEYPETITQEDLLKHIEELNNDPNGNTLLLKDKSLNDRISAAFHKIEINMDEVHAIQLDPELMSDLEILKQKIIRK